MTRSHGEREENESLSSSKKPIQLVPDFSECSVDKQADNVMKTIDLPSDLNFDQTDTIDNSNCATSPSKSTYVSSIPGTIYYNGPGSETQPQIQNARKVSDLESCQIFAKNDPVPHKTRPTPVRIDSEQSSVPRMQWTPPQPLSGNGHPVRSSKPQYQTYASSADQDHIIPAIPVEELSMDGFTDRPLKRGPGFCWMIKGYKMLLILTAIVIALAISAVILSILYVTGSDEQDNKGTQVGQTFKRDCHDECYNPFKPNVICRCSCYTNKDDKFYTCGPQTDDFADVKQNSSSHESSSNDSNSNDSNDQEIERVVDPIDATWYGGTPTDAPLSDDILVDDDAVPVPDDTTDDTNDDNNDNLGDDLVNFDAEYDDLYPSNTSTCPNLCFRKNIHRLWSPTFCPSECYGNDSKQRYNRNMMLYIQWSMGDDY